MKPKPIFVPPTAKPVHILPDSTAKIITAMANSLPEDVDTWSGEDDLVNDELTELMDKFFLGRTRSVFKKQLFDAGAKPQLIFDFFAKD